MTLVYTTYANGMQLFIKVNVNLCVTLYKLKMAAIICDSHGGMADDILLFCIEKASHTSMGGKHNIVTFLIPLLG